MEHVDDDWLGIVADCSGMARAVAEFDWHDTPLGPRQAWPEGLRAAASICLSTRFPALIVGGPELVSIYNDGYREILGDKHPRALGTPAAKVWPELWPDISPLFEYVMTSGRPTWEQDAGMIIERNGFREECYFTFSYSPLYEQGQVAGVLDLVYETTDQVVANRRLECVAALNAALADAEQVTQICVTTASALTAHARDVRFVDVFLRAGEQVVLVASNRRDDANPATRIDLDAVIDGRPVVLGGDPSGIAPAELVALPIGGTFRGLDGAIVIGLNPMRPFDRHYDRFVEAIADTVSSALEGAYRRSVEVGEYRRISDTLQAAMLPPSQDLPTIAARYLPAVGSLAVGGDWYDVIDLDEQRRALVVGDCVGHGLEAATVMGQLRAAARAMLLEGRRPADVLAGLDTFAAHVDGASCATVALAIYDRSTLEITYARAGHPPMLIVGPSGNRWLAEPAGPPLAVPCERLDVTLGVTDEEAILLYTDGLIERRGESLDEGMRRLATAAARLHAASAQTAADELLRELHVEDARDDVVLVVKRLDGPSPS